MQYVIIVIIVIVVLFLIGRELLCWYYKINERIELQKETNDLLRKLIEQKNESFSFETKKYDKESKELVANIGVKTDMEASFTSEPDDTINFNSNHIIGNPIKIGNLEVAQNDFPPMNWDDAKIACENLGSEWRLPNKDELNALYLNKDKIGGFLNKYYWNYIESDYNSAWGQYFGNGNQFSSNKFLKNYVRAVRTIK